MRYVLFMGDQMEYIQQAESVDGRILNKMEMAMICGLHFELRVGGKLIKSLLNESKQYLNGPQFTERMQQCDQYFNEVFSKGKYSTEELAMGEVAAGDFRTCVEEGKVIDF